MASSKSAAKVTTEKPSTPEEKSKALTTCSAHIEKQFGKGAIMRLGDNRTMDVEIISTGSLALDIALGAGGLPMGRIV